MQYSIVSVAYNVMYSAWENDILTLHKPIESRISSANGFVIPVNSTSMLEADLPISPPTSRMERGGYIPRSQASTNCVALAKLSQKHTSMVVIYIN